VRQSSSSIGTLAAALAKAQAHLTNPEKSLTATIRTERPGGGERSFRYAPLASGLEIVRKTLSQHEIATVQATAVDDQSGMVKLTTTLAHSSGEWIASDWPVCRIADLATPHRMGAALTYARRYALFTMVGIAGEDDVDAPDLNALPGGVPSGEARSHAGSGYGAASGQERRVRVRPQRVILTPDNSTALREQLLCELKELASSEALAVWAQRTLPLKNQLTAADAQEVEIAFAAKLATFSDDAVLRDEPEPDANAIGGERAIANKPRRRRGKPKGEQVRQSEAAGPNVSTDAAIPHDAPYGTMTYSKPLRVRDPDHLKFVTTQPCLICGRRPSDAHHLRFAQPQALGRRVSDEYTVPLCRLHHRELHRGGEESSWWKHINLNPLETAQQLWRATHPGSKPLDFVVATPA
jgi:hypothetical protein